MQKKGCSQAVVVLKVTHNSHNFPLLRQAKKLIIIIGQVKGILEQDFFQSRRMIKEICCQV